MDWLVNNMGTIGWIWLGILIGVVSGVVASSFGAASKIGDLEAEIIQGRAIRDALKDEIFRLENQAKPKPRKRRKKRVVKTDKIKVGK
jgi:hypothetical protein|tara:strand:+ start:27802 stop:28065 length:264 start_codon:yes stop_codon:yes gene_type:complete